MVVKCCHYGDPEYNNLVTEENVAYNRYFYIHGDLEDYFNKKYPKEIQSDCCSIYNISELPLHHGKNQVILNGEYDVEIHDCPFKCKGYFYTRNDDDNKIVFLRGYIVKVGDIESEKLAKYNMETKKKFI